MLITRVVAFTGILLAMSIGCAAAHADKCLDGSGPAGKETRKVGAFQELKVHGGIDVLVTQGKQHSVVVEASAALLPHLETSVHGGVLSLAFDTCIRRSGTVRAHITMPAVRGVAVLGSGDVVGSGRFRSDELDIDITGSGDVRLDVEVKKLSVEIKGSGDVRIVGSAAHQKVAVHGSGDVDLSKAPGRTARVEVNGSGDVRVRVTESLDASVAGSGDIAYHGKPASLRRSVAGSGDIRAAR